MAHRYSGLLWARGKRRDRFTNYKLRESQRPHAVDDTKKGAAYWRVCSGRELETRREEFAAWPDETKAWHGANYPAAAAIKEHFKQRNEGLS